MSEEVQRRWQARQRLWQQAFAPIDLTGKRVLDAGSGEGFFTRFLLDQKPSQLVSITCDAEHARQVEKQFIHDDRLRVRVADLTRMPQVESGSFDVIGADFLIAAVSAYTPYREVECLKELYRVLAPGGRLVLTGWEIWPEIRNATEKQLRQLFTLREACHHLAGSTPYREHPKEWLQARLGDLGMPTESMTTVADVLHDVDWLLANIRAVIDRVQPAYLREALLQRQAELAIGLRGDPTLVLGLEFGRLFAVTGCKLEGAILLNG